MTVPNWPSTLCERPLVGSVQGYDIDRAVTFRPERGDDIERAGLTADIEEMAMTFHGLDLVQLAAFRDFVRNDLAGGVLAFNWTDPITSLSGVWRLVSSNGQRFAYVQRSRGRVDVTVTMRRVVPVGV